MANRTLFSTKDDEVRHEYRLELIEGGETIELSSNEVARLNGNIINYERTEHQFGLTLIHYYSRSIPWWEKEKIIKEYLAQQAAKDEETQEDK